MSAPLAQGSPTSLACSLWQKRIPPFSPPFLRFFLFPSIEFAGRGGSGHLRLRREWNIFIKRGWRIPEPQTRPEHEPRQWRFGRLFLSLPSLLRLIFAGCRSVGGVAGWLKSAPCHGCHISPRHKTCRTINKQQASVRSSTSVCEQRVGGGRER